MKKGLLLFNISLLLLSCSFAQTMPDKKYTYLALGDSYTIGESVSAEDNFPFQTIKLLKKEGYVFQEPTIVAKTGWTTDELQRGIRKVSLEKEYSVVSLLIGVNNQYRGRALDEYANHFEELLKQSIQYAGNKVNHVFILSIPDWGITPFAEGRDRNKIAREIDAFNEAAKKLAAVYSVHYVEITTGTREALNDNSLLAEDKLHPSGKEYFRWAQKLVTLIATELK